MRIGVAIAAVLLAFACQADAAAGQDVSKDDIPGVKNFARIGTTVACAGATSPKAIAGMKQMGFVSVINLRRSDEPGADVEAEEAAAHAAGLRYFHIPF